MGTTAESLDGFDTAGFDPADVGAVAATALRGIKSLAERAPAGRLFASIATLADSSSAAAVEFTAAAAAPRYVEGRLSKAIAHINTLREQAEAEAREAAPLPAFLRRK